MRSGVPPGSPDVWCEAAVVEIGQASPFNPRSQHGFDLAHQHLILWQSEREGFAALLRPAGAPDAVAAAGDAAKARGAKRVTGLEVSGAFHTPFMSPARDRLGEAIDRTELRVPDGVVVANVDGGIHSNPATWRALMNAQLCSPVRWSQTLQTLSGEGFPTFVELGPGKVLTGLVKRSLKGALRLTVNTPDDLDTLLDALAAPPDDVGGSPEGEHLFATDRMVVSPCAGVFTPVPGLDPGHQVAAGALLGHIGAEEVHSPFAGELMGWLAVDTERVTSSKPIAWLRAT